MFNISSTQTTVIYQLSIHIVPQAYVELNEFQDSKWLETARWLGYEENFNPVTQKWGPSHVSYLTFKTLLQLRKIMGTGDFGPLSEAELSMSLMVMSC